MTAGKQLTNREEHPESYNIPCIIIDPDTLTNVDDKKFDSKSNSSTVDEVPNWDVKTSSTSGESCSRLYKCEECEQ